MSGFQSTPFKVVYHDSHIVTTPLIGLLQCPCTTAIPPTHSRLFLIWFIHDHCSFFTYSPWRNFSLFPHVHSWLLTFCSCMYVARLLWLLAWWHSLCTLMRDSNVRKCRYRWLRCGGSKRSYAWLDFLPFVESVPLAMSNQNMNVCVVGLGGLSLHTACVWFWMNLQQSGQFMAGYWIVREMSISMQSAGV